MPIIHVVKPFLLKDDDHKLTEYKVGRYDVPQEIAEHWYVIPHLEGFVEPPPKAGTDQLRVLLAEQAARVAEPVEDQTQPPAEPHSELAVQTAPCGAAQRRARHDVVHRSEDGIGDRYAGCRAGRQNDADHLRV